MKDASGRSGGPADTSAAAMRRTARRSWGREREIAQLVALGLTSREIAARLFLSDKTVESRLTSAFAKLGISSRAALAAQAAAF